MTMVERVARALLADKNPDLPWDDASDLCRNDFLGHARAAIESMREPTAHETSQTSYMTGEWSRRNVEAYISAALKEKE